LRKTERHTNHGKIEKALGPNRSRHYWSAESRKCNTCDKKICIWRRAVTCSVICWLTRAILLQWKLQIM